MSLQSYHFNAANQPPLILRDCLSPSCRLGSGDLSESRAPHQAPEINHRDLIRRDSMLNESDKSLDLPCSPTRPTTRDMSDPDILIVETPLLTTGCILGEGPIYDPESRILHFLDIDRKRVYHCNTDTLALSFDEFEESVTALAPRREGRGLACVTASGFGLIEEDENSKARLIPLARALSDEELLYARLNDGACDSRGRFVAATLESKHPGHEFGGVLYQYDPSDGSCKILDDQDITDGNGLGWSEDNRTLYFTNSCINEIYAYDYDVENGTISNRRTFVHGPSVGLDTPSFMDGLCFDSEGCIWSARWSGSKIVRFNREGTGITFEIHFPRVFSVTACCFGGPDNDQLFVTTAHPSAAKLADSDALFERYPDSGHVYRIDFHGRYTGGTWRYAFGG